MKNPFTDFVPSGSAWGREADTCHNGADFEIHLYARSLQKAAKILVEKLDWNENSETAWDVGPTDTAFHEDDWPILATALALDCPIWTKDTDFLPLRCGDLDNRPSGTVPGSGASVRASRAVGRRPNRKNSRKF